MSFFRPVKSFLHEPLSIPQDWELEIKLHIIFNKKKHKKLHITKKS
jgi:hypothetical protein